MVFSNISDLNEERAKNIYINVKSEFDLSSEKLTKNINNKFALRGN